MPKQVQRNPANQRKLCPRNIQPKSCWRLRIKSETIVVLTIAGVTTKVKQIAKTGETRKQAKNNEAPVRT